MVPIPPIKGTRTLHWYLEMQHPKYKATGLNPENFEVAYIVPSQLIRFYQSLTCYERTSIKINYIITLGAGATQRFEVVGKSMEVLFRSPIKREGYSRPVIMISLTKGYKREVVNHTGCLHLFTAAFPVSDVARLFENLPLTIERNQRT